MKTSYLVKIMCVVAVILAPFATYGTTYNLTGTTGSGSIDYYYYSNNKHEYFIINTGTYQPISMQFVLNLHYSDVVRVYRVYNDETEELIEQITGLATTRNIQSNIPTGRAKIEFISDNSISYDYGQNPTLTGFSFSYSTQPISYSNNIMTDGNATITGNLGVGISNPLTRLHINGSIRGNGTAGTLTVNTTYGNVTMGAINTTQAAFTTDRSMYTFDKSVRLNDGILSSGNANLTLQTYGATRMTVLRSNGNVGIGTNTPTQALSVKGNLSLSPSGTTPVENYNGGLMITKPFTSNQYINLNNGVWAWSIGIKDSSFALGPGNTNDGSFAPSFVIKPEGLVGIGTKNPQYLLDVKGIIRATEVKIQSVDQFADFVFAKDYALPTLNEVDNFIQTNGHLPDVPSAAEVKENGINLVEMQVKLLQKVEELTLYTIEQQKMIEQQTRIMAQQQQLIDAHKEAFKSQQERLNALEKTLK